MQTQSSISVFLLQAHRNAAARETLLKEFGVLESAPVPQARGELSRAHHWKRERRIFSVAHQGRTYFPGFQFDAEGQPRAVIAEVIAALEPCSSEWELALWFAATSGWLGGRRPVDLLESDPEAVVEAAHREAAELIF